MAVCGLALDVYAKSTNGMCFEAHKGTHMHGPHVPLTPLCATSSALCAHAEHCLWQRRTRQCTLANLYYHCNHHGA